MAAAALCTFLNISALLFLLLASSVYSLSFDISSINNSCAGSFKVEGAASITDQGIQLTPFEGDQVYKAGRAMHVDPLRLWDKASGNLADFTTLFTFNISSDGNTNYGDGLAFFLAAFSTPIDAYNQRSYCGGSLGLTDGTQTTAPDPFVAVVFDTYSSHPQTSVSINVRSTQNSVKSATWLNYIPQGMPNNASITYSASSKILQVDFTGYLNGQWSAYSLSHEVDLRVQGLPESVSIGFSAATGGFFEKHTVSSWRFGSTLPRPAGSLPPSPKNKVVKIIIGVTVGAVCLVVCFIVYWLCKKRSPKNQITPGEDAMEAGVQAAKLGANVAAELTSEGCAKAAQVPPTECCAKVAEEPCAEDAEADEGIFEGCCHSLLAILGSG